MGTQQKHQAFVAEPAKEESSSNTHQNIRQILLISAGASHSVALLCKNSFSIQKYHRILFIWCFDDSFVYLRFLVLFFSFFFLFIGLWNFLIILWFEG